MQQCPGGKRRVKIAGCGLLACSISPVLLVARKFFFAGPACSIQEWIDNDVSKVRNFSSAGKTSPSGRFPRRALFFQMRHLGSN